MEQNISTPDWLIDSKKAAQYLGVSESAIRIWVSDGYIPHIKVGRLVKFDLRSLEKWLVKNEKSGSKTHSGKSEILDAMEH